ncbi:MAG: Lrp/AsnC family transcriptional regulator [Candidatus Woesearchaeota archaeon]
MIYKLDLKDKKILHELDFNARQSYSELAKKVWLSKQGTEYRVNNLIKKGIITRFYPVINVPKLGYFYCRISIIWQNVGPEELKKIYEDVKADTRVFWIFEVQGEFDFFCGLWCRTLTDFRYFVDEFMVKYSRYVKTHLENIATDVVHYEHRYLLGVQATEEIHIAESPVRIPLDELDKQILILLAEDARTSLVTLGQKLKEHPKTIAYRIQRMEKQQLIEKYRIGIDHNALGYTYYKIFLNISDFNHQELRKLKEFIKNHPATIYLIEGINLHGDLDFEMMIKDNQELFDFIKLLRKEFPKIVGNYRTAIFMDTLKVRYLPF